MTTPDPQGEWLVVVDMQRVFADPESPWATPGFAAIVDPNRRLVEQFGERVVFTRFVAPETPTGAWRAYYEQWPFALVAPDDRLYHLVDELPRAGRPVVTRTTFGKWDELPGSLRDVTGGAPLVVTGVSTDCCVLSTVLAAADAGVAVRVVADACAGLSEVDHRRALDAMALYAPLVEVVTSDQVTRGTDG